MTRLNLSCMYLCLCLSSHLLLLLSVPTKAKVYFLITAYDTLNNIQVWERFFKGVSPLEYKIFIHLKWAERFVQPAYFHVNVINSTFNGYCKNSKVMNALFEAALNDSAEDRDGFVLISSDSIPVKSFSEIRTFLCGGDANSTAPSRICITPTNQWLGKQDSGYFPKSHMWLAMNKADTIKAVKAQQANPEFHETFMPAWSESEAKLLEEGTCWEELWHAAVIYGPYKPTAHDERYALQYPSERDQGYCIMYVWWPDYKRDVSVFASNGIPDLSERNMEPTSQQTFRQVPVSLLTALKASPTFLFARKIHTHRENHGALREDGSVIPLLQAIEELQLYGDAAAESSATAGSVTAATDLGTVLASLDDIKAKLAELAEIKAELKQLRVQSSPT